MLPSPPARPRLRWRQMRLSNRICLIALLLLLLGGMLEAGARLYWWKAKGAPHTDAESIWRTTYTEVADSGIDRVAPHHGDGTFDVLLLGGSVLHPICGDIAVRLRARLEEKLGRPVRVVNFAYPGRTSGDSRMKYARLGDRRFDLVIVYHGINDAFMNNCPPGSFRADYTHACHIAQMKALDRHPEVGWFALLYTAEYVALNLASRWNLRSEPRHRLSHFGADVRTPPAFEANLDTIAELAARRGDRLMLATFAYYFPADYSEEAFLAKKLDYDKHGCAASTWGRPANLIAALDAHNAATRRVARRHGTLFADVAARLSGGRLCFDDPCHLNAEGCRRWVELIVEQLDPALPAASASER